MQYDSDLKVLLEKIDAQDIVIEKMAHDLKRIKQFFMWSLIGTVVTFVLPLLAAVIILPIFLSRYLETFNGLL